MKIAKVIKAKDLRQGDRLLCQDSELATCWQIVESIDRDLWGAATGVEVKLLGVKNSTETLGSRDRVLVVRQMGRYTVPARPKHKYGAKATMVDGIRFASMAEAKRYGELKLLEKAGKITRLVLQPSFKLYAPRTGIHGDMIIGGWQNLVGVYRADFAYDELTPKVTRWVIEDVKGFKTSLYRWKKKHVEAQYGITITEVA